MFEFLLTMYSTNAFVAELDKSDVIYMGEGATASEAVTACINNYNKHLQRRCMECED